MEINIIQTYKTTTTMASMGFSQSTITQLMTLVEDNKDNVNEATYLEMCNVMKFVYEKSKIRGSLPNAPVSVSPSAPSPTRHEEERFYMENGHSYTRSQLERMLQTNRASLSNLSIRVDNFIKTRALREKCRDMGIPEFRGVRGFHFYRNDEVKRVEEMLVAAGMPMSAIKAKYQSVKLLIFNRQKTAIMNKINIIERMLEY